MRFTNRAPGVIIFIILSKKYKNFVKLITTRGYNEIIYLVVIISRYIMKLYTWWYNITRYRTSAITSPGFISFFHFQSPLLLTKIRVLIKVRVLFNVGYYLRSYGILFQSINDSCGTESNNATNQYFCR